MQAGNYSGSVLAGQIKVIFTDAENEREIFLIINAGDCVLGFGRGYNGFDMGREIRVEPGEVVTSIADHLGGAGCRFLNVENMGKTQGNYRVARSG